MNLTQEDIIEQLKEVQQELGEVYERLLRQYPVDRYQAARVSVLAAKSRIHEAELFLKEIE